MTLRAVEIAETAHGFRVSTDCKSRPEAVGVALAIFNMPVPAAFAPADLPTLPEGHPANADSEDSTDGINAQTRAVVE